MTTAIEIPVVTSPAPANYPFAVQIKNAGKDFCTHDTAVTLAAAKEVAQELVGKGLEVRIEHSTGGIEKTTILPKWQQLAGKDDRPHRIALWSGKNPPPKVGERVVIGMNSIGPGTVTGYAVMDGYLGVLVQVDEATRPDWHKRQNPGNPPALAFGIELKAN